LVVGVVGGLTSVSGCCGGGEILLYQVDGPLRWPQGRFGRSGEENNLCPPPRWESNPIFWSSNQTDCAMNRRVNDMSYSFENNVTCTLYPCRVTYFELRSSPFFLFR
jgi:hypothetical protein